MKIYVLVLLLMLCAIPCYAATGTVAEGEGIDITRSGSTVTFSGEDASTTNKGIASFNSSHFSVSSGAVSVLNGDHAAQNYFDKDTDDINDVSDYLSESGSTVNYKGTEIGSGSGAFTDAQPITTATANRDLSIDGNLSASVIMVGKGESGVFPVFASQDKLIIDSDGNTRMQIVSGADNAGIISFSDGTQGMGRFFYNHANNKLETRVNGNNTRMEIDASGDVDFDQNVQVDGDLTVGDQLAVNGSPQAGTNVYIATTASNDVFWIDCDDSNASPRIDEGIVEFRRTGTGTAVYHNNQLEIINTNSTANNTTGIEFNNSQEYPTSGIQGIHADHTNGSADGHIRLWTTANDVTAEHLRITNLGNIGIGTTSPNAKLEVDGDLSINQILTVSDLRGVTDIDVTTENAFEGTIDHDDLPDFIANEHIDWTNATSSLSTTGTCIIGSDLTIFGVLHAGSHFGSDLTTDGTLYADTIDSATGSGITIAEDLTSNGTFYPTFYGARAWQSTQQTNLTDNTETTLTLDGESFDPQNRFASNAYTTEIAGYYRIDFQAVFDNVTTDDQITGVVYAGGSAVLSSRQQLDDYVAGYTAVGASSVLNLTENSVVHVKVKVSGSDGSVDILNQQDETFLSIQYVGH